VEVEEVVVVVAQDHPPVSFDPSVVAVVVHRIPPLALAHPPVVVEVVEEDH